MRREDILRKLWQDIWLYQQTFIELRCKCILITLYLFLIFCLIVHPPDISRFLERLRDWLINEMSGNCVLFCSCFLVLVLAFLFSRAGPRASVRADDVTDDMIGSCWWHSGLCGSMISWAPSWHHRLSLVSGADLPHPPCFPMLVWWHHWLPQGAYGVTLSHLRQFRHVGDETTADWWLVPLSHHKGDVIIIF